jgi:ABC-type Na+ transport system ATPase subunit NatA
MQEAERLSDRLVIMESGRFVAAGTAETLRQETQSASLEEVFFRVTGLDYSQADSERETVGEGGSL